MTVATANMTDNRNVMPFPWKLHRKYRLCAMARGRSSVVGASLFLRPVDDDRQKEDRQIQQSLRPVRHIAAERERISRLERVGLLAVPIFELALEHIDEL